MRVRRLRMLLLPDTGEGFRAEPILKGTGKKDYSAILKVVEGSQEKSRKSFWASCLWWRNREWWLLRHPHLEKSGEGPFRSFPGEMEARIGLTTINFTSLLSSIKVSPLSAGAFLITVLKLEGCYSEGNHLIKNKVIPSKTVRVWCPRFYIVKISGASLRLNFLSVWVAWKLHGQGNFVKKFSLLFSRLLPPQVCPVKSKWWDFSAEASYLAAHIIRMWK